MRLVVCKVSKLSNWAAEALSDEDLEAYNETVESGTVSKLSLQLSLCIHNSKRQVRLD